MNNRFILLLLILIFVITMKERVVEGWRDGVESYTQSNEVPNKRKEVVDYLI